MKNDSGREIALFTAALELSLWEREVFLRRMCGGHSNLRRKVEALLRVYDQIGKFLEEQKPETRRDRPRARKQSRQAADPPFVA